LPGQDDRSSGSRTLPSAELNPLLNPLLAENMGRWAEVYFISPPERREQAVLELLRELEAKKSRQNEEPIHASDYALAQTADKAGTYTRCEACGGENPLSHKYCGMCGAGLGDARAYSPFGERSSSRAAEEPSAHDEQVEAYAHERRENRQETQYDEEDRNDPYPAAREFTHHSNGNGLSLFQASAENGSDENIEWAEELEPSPPYRYYIGAVLAIVILVLGYMAWRGTQASQNSHEASAPPPPSASDSAPAPAPAPPAKTAADEPSGPSPAAAPTTGGSAHTSPPQDVTKNPAETKSSRHQTAQTQEAETAATRAVPSPAEGSPVATPTAQSTQPTAGNGGEELAMAERYLNGAAGQRRDTTQAAKWLWKSVAKHNGQATVLLSDLYLKGEGVSKNCDQARVLLDSAARKGVAGAGERLRNMPAFGCE